MLEATGLRFNWDEELAGVAAVEATGTPLPDATVESIRKNSLALKGPLTTPVGIGFRSVNVGLRKEFELFANVRPARTIIPGGRFENVDIVLVRENLEGLYIGVEHFVAIGDDPRAVGESLAIVTRHGCERIVRYAFEYALKHGRRKVTIVHKANILKMVSGLFLEVGQAIAKEYEGRVESNDMIVDNTAMQLVLRPEQFDVMVTTNMFGDILSDEVSGPGRRARAGARSQHRDQGGDLRGGAWQRARHRREGRGQSLGPDAGRRHDARPHRGAGPRPADPGRHRHHHRAGRDPDPGPRRDRLDRGVRQCCRQAGCLRSPAPSAGAGSRDCRGASCAPTAGPSGRGVQVGWRSRISLAATVLMAAYVALRVPADPMARLYAAIAVLATYIIVRRIATRVAMEYLK